MAGDEITYPEGYGGGHLTVYADNSSDGSIGSVFSDLFTGQGLEDLGHAAGMAAPFFAPAAAFGAAGGFAGGGATAGGLGEAGSAMAFAPEGVGYGEAPAWFSSLGESGMSGGLPAVEGGGSMSEFLALTAPETAGLEGFTAGAGGGMDLGMAVEPVTAGVGGEAAAFGGELPGAGLEAAAGAGGTTPAGAGAPSFWDKMVTGATNSITRNPIGIGAGAIALGSTMLGGQKDSPELDALRAQAAGLSGQAASLNAQGQQLASYLQSGTLPPGLQASVKSAADAFKARIIQNHAKNGMSTNPSQNSALAQELAQADINAIMMTAQLGQQLMQSGQEFLKMGMSATGLSERIYESLIKLDREQSAATGKAIANFASAFSGGGTTLRLAA